jgi:hypothetical protein
MRDFPVEIRVRVGIYGHFWEIPASSIFSLPRGMTDSVMRDALPPIGKGDKGYGA